MKISKDNLELGITWLGVATGFILKIIPWLQFVALVLAIFISINRLKRDLNRDK